MASLTASCIVLALGVVLAGGCTEQEPNQSGPTLVLEGRVADTSGVVIEGASIWVRLWDTTGTQLADDTLWTDGAGEFSGLVSVAAAPDSTNAFLFVLPPWGSGWGADDHPVPVRFDKAGRAERTNLLLSMIRREAPVPSGPPSPLAAADLAGEYSGQTVHPINKVGGAYLDLSFTPVANGAFGRYAIDFDASTVCGDGQGSVTGLVVRDTLFLRLTSDSFPGWNREPLINEFIATTYIPGADTLILTYPGEGGDCPWGFPAPLRLGRQ